MNIILGTAHLATTPWKRSIDGRLREYAYSREIVNRLQQELWQLRQGHSRANE